MFRTLHARLVLVTLALFIPLASVFVWLTLRTSQAYFQEVTQEINTNLASALVVDTPDLMIGETIDFPKFDYLSVTLAMTNPGVEIYVLNNEGLIVGSSVNDELERNVIDTQPIRSFLNEDMLPIRGDDPRNNSGEKIFSVAPLSGGEGYLYVILADQTRESFAATLFGSTVFRVVLWGSAVLLALVILLAVLAFTFLTRRLRRLESAMTSFKAQDFVMDAPLLPKVKRPQDEIDQLQNVFGDMSERISEQLLGLREVDRLRRELISNVSHDLRTPLAALQGYLETLHLKKDSLSQEDKDRYLSVASKQSQRLGHLVKDLFELSRFDADAVKPNLEKFPLPELVQDIVVQFQDHAAAKGVTLAMKVDYDIPLVKLDLGMMERALTNLIDNAIQHTNAGGNVTLELLKKAKSVEVRVSDTGKGISSKDLEHIFERYYRVSNERGSDGAGLGLAITKRIVDLHQASIRVSSELGRGTSFSFDLAVA